MSHGRYYRLLRLLETQYGTNAVPSLAKSAALCSTTSSAVCVARPFGAFLAADTSSHRRLHCSPHQPQHVANETSTCTPTASTEVLSDALASNSSSVDGEARNQSSAPTEQTAALRHAQVQDPLRYASSALHDAFPRTAEADVDQTSSRDHGCGQPESPLGPAATHTQPLSAPEPPQPNEHQGPPEQEDRPPKNSTTKKQPTYQETAVTFLRAAEGLVRPYEDTAAPGRLATLIRRLGSVPSPQVKERLGTFKSTVMNLMRLALEVPLLDTPNFLLGYARSIVRHPRLLVSLKSDAEYRPLLHRLVFHAPHAGHGDVAAADAPPAESERDPDTDASVNRAIVGPSPVVFKQAEAFPDLLQALLKLQECPEAFWSAIEDHGIPHLAFIDRAVIAEQSTAEGSAAGNGASVGPGGVVEADEGSAGAMPIAAVRTEERTAADKVNSRIALRLTEMLTLRDSVKASPAEGLDVRRIAQNDRQLPALPTQPARHTIESFVANCTPQLTPMDVAFTVYNLGQTKVPPRLEVICTLEERILRDASGLSVNLLALVWGGYAAMRVRPGPPLEDALARRTAQVTKGATMYTIMVLLLQTAKLGAVLPERPRVALMERMHELLQQRDYETRKFAPRLLWACAVYAVAQGGRGQRAGSRRARDQAAEVYGKAAWAALEAYAAIWEAGRIGRDAEASTILRQAHHALEALKHKHDWEIPGGSSVNRFAQHCRRIALNYAERQSETAFVFGMRQDILQCAKRLCRSDDSRCIVESKVLWGDNTHFSYVMVRSGDRRVAVELEGLSNIVCSASGEAIGVTAKPLLRNWALRRWGHDVVSIVESEWTEETIASQEFEECLQAELRAKGLPL